MKIIFDLMIDAGAGPDLPRAVFPKLFCLVYPLSLFVIP